jgi:hypothetical protein
VGSGSNNLRCNIGRENGDGGSIAICGRNIGGSNRSIPYLFEREVPENTWIHPARSSCGLICINICPRTAIAT